MPINFEPRPRLPMANEVLADSEGLEFWKKTEFHPVLSQRDFERIARSNSASRPFKSYPFAERITLARSSERESPMTFSDVIRSRRSVRSFGVRPVTLEDLSRVLELGYAIRSEDGSRNVGSGGSCYPTEVYLYAGNVQGIKSGLYHYNVGEFCLELLDTTVDGRALQRAFHDTNIDWARVPVVLIFTSVFSRTLNKYGMRGWRILLLDAGHLAQAIWLSACSVGLGGTTLGGGLDRSIRNLLQVNDEQEGYVCSFVLGHPKE